MRLSSWMRGGTGRSLIRVRPLQHVVLCRATLERLHREWPRPCPHLHWDWPHPRHICTGTGLTPATSARSHLHRDLAHWSRICTLTGLTQSQWLCAFGARGSASAARGCRLLSPSSATRRVPRGMPLGPLMPRGALHAESLQGGKIERFITDAFTNTCAAHCPAARYTRWHGIGLARCALVCTEGHRVIVAFRGAAAATEQRRRCRDVASPLETPG
jgi:hypothetical protein